MRLLLLGARGLLGQELARELACHDLLALGRDDYDLTDPGAARRLGDGGLGPFDVVVNAAAYTAVDRAEAEPDAAYAANRDGVARLGEATDRLGAALLHVSTDFVFGGDASAPRLESDPVQPLGVYAESKRAGEVALREHPAAWIWRTAWTFGPAARCFPHSILAAHRAGKPLRVVADQTGTPTYAPDLARAIRRALEVRIPHGLYHAAGDEVVTWHELARRTVAVAGGDPEDVAAIGTDDWPTPARRPVYSALDSDRLRTAISPWSRPLDDALRDLIAREPN